MVASILNTGTQTQATTLLKLETGRWRYLRGYAAIINDILIYRVMQQHLTARTTVHHVCFSSRLCILIPNPLWFVLALLTVSIY